VRFYRHAHRALNRGDRVPVTPIPWRDECTLPDAGLVIASSHFITVIGVRIPRVRERPSRTNQPTLNIFAIDFARSHRSLVAVVSGYDACPRTVRDLRLERLERLSAALPAFDLRTDAELTGLGRVDALQANPDAVDFHGIGIVDPRNAYQLFGVRVGCSERQQRNSYEVQLHRPPPARPANPDASRTVPAQQSNPQGLSKKGATLKEQGRRDNRRRKGTATRRKAIMRERLAIEQEERRAWRFAPEYVGDCDCDVCRGLVPVPGREHDPAQLEFHF
jgi:hypothetical protein